MRKKNHLLILPALVIAMLLFACTSSEIVSGNYTGKVGQTDTVDGTAKVVKVSDAYIRIEVTRDSTSFIEYAKLGKTGDGYSLIHKDTDGNIALQGYYYDGFIHVESLTNSFVFDGERD